MERELGEDEEDRPVSVGHIYVLLGIASFTKSRERVGDKNSRFGEGRLGDEETVGREGRILDKS